MSATVIKNYKGKHHNKYDMQLLITVTQLTTTSRIDK